MGRCFACDHPANFLDKDTMRTYCSACWNIIEDLIREGSGEEEIHIDVRLLEVMDEQEDSSDARDVS